jgi:hypothetical protein
MQQWFEVSITNSPTGEVQQSVHSNQKDVAYEIQIADLSLMVLFHYRIEIIIIHLRWNIFIYTIPVDP